MGKLTILSNEVIVTKREEEILILIALAVEIDWQQCQTLPFLVEKPRIYLSTVVYAKAVELAIHIKVQPRTILRRSDVAVENSTWRNSTVIAVIFCGFDICRIGDIKYVGVSVYAFS